MLLARGQAELLESRLTQQQDKPAPTTEQRRVPNKPVAEKASGAAPPRDERPLDEFDAAVMALRKEKTRRVASSSNRYTRFAASVGTPVNLL